MAKVDVLLEDNSALRNEIADAHAVLDNIGRPEPARRLSERVDGLCRDYAELRRVAHQTAFAATAFERNQAGQRLRVLLGREG